MKSEMKTKALRFLSDIQTGPFGSQLHKEDYVDDGTPIVTVEHLGNRVFTEQNLPRVSNEDKQRLSKYILKEGDIVFSRVGSVDRCSFVDSQHTGWLFSGRCLRVRPFEEISPLFLYYFFCLESTKKFIRNIAVGATMPSINTKLMGEIEVSYPDKQVQEKIANLLGAIDNKIELNNAINDNLEAAAQAIYKKMFVDDVDSANLPDGWKIIALENVAELSAGGDRPAVYSDYPTDVCNVPIFSNGIDKEGLYGFTDKAKVFEESVTVSARGTVGYVFLREKPYVPIVRLISVVPNTMHITAKYLLFALSAIDLHSTGTSQQQITVPDFKKRLILVPNKQSLDTFMQRITPLFNSIKDNKAEIESLLSLQANFLTLLSR